MNSSKIKDENNKNLTLTHTKPNTKMDINSLRTRPRGNRRSEAAELRIQKDIFDLSANHNDLEIMALLKIPNQTYYRIKSKMYEEAKELWQQTIQESIEYRALHLLNSLNFAKINQEIALDTKQPAKDRIEASINVLNAQEALFSYEIWTRCSKAC